MPIETIEHKGRKVVLLDFRSWNSEAVALQEIEGARAFFAKQPRERTLLTLIDVENAVYTMKVVESLQALAKSNTPLVIASAATGLSTLRRLIVRIISLGSGRKFGIFRGRSEALDWLVQQKEPPKQVPEDFAETDTIRVPDQT